MSDNMGYQPQVLSATISREKEIAIMIRVHDSNHD